MAESKRPNCRTKGAVLIMVLTIMFVLIIMLIATLSVVATAKQRTYTSFEETQASLTSRSAIEFFVKDLSNNNSTKITGSVDPYYTASTEMTYARQIEMDIRTLKAIDTDKSVTGTGATDKWYTTWLGDNSKPVPTDCDPDNFSYDDNDPDALYQYFDNTAPAEPAQMKVGATAITYNNGSGSSSDPPMLKYEVTLPKAENGTNKYGKFADSDQKVIVTVEVLDRYYNKGTFNGVTSAKYGDRTKDYVKLRVTATAVFDDYESTTVIIVEPTTPPTVLRNDFTKGVVATGSATATPKIYALGGMAANSNYTMTDNNIFDSLYVNGDLTFGSSGTLNLGPDCYIVATGDIYYNSSAELLSRTNKSYIYAGGTFNMTVNGKIGDSSHPLDIICNGGKITQGGPIYGDIYCEGDLIIGEANIIGDIYCSGTVYLQNNKYLKASNFNDPSTWILDSGSGQKVEGKIHSGDIRPWAPADPYAWPVPTLLTYGSTNGISTLLGTYSSVVDNTALSEDLSYFETGTSEPDLNAATPRPISQYKTTETNKTVNDAKLRTITLSLPGNMYGTGIGGIPAEPKKYEIPSFEYEYPVYLSVSENPATGTTTGYKLDGYVSALDKYMKDTGQTKDEDGNNLVDLNKFTSTNATVSGGKISSDGILPATTYSGTTIIKPGVTLQLEAGTYYGTFIADDDTDDINIIIPDNTSVTLKCQIYSKDLAQILKAGPYSASPTHKNGTIYAGFQSTPGIKCDAPRINMYVGTGATVTFDDEGPTPTLINAYIYGPNATLNLGKSRSNTSMSYNDCTPFSHRCAAVGAMVFGNVNATDDSAVVFIPQGTSSTPPHPPGESLIAWGVNHYTNDKEYGNT